MYTGNRGSVLRWKAPGQQVEQQLGSSDREDGHEDLGLGLDGRPDDCGRHTSIP
jgi:hypothetical protein